MSFPRSSLWDSESSQPCEDCALALCVGSRFCSPAQQPCPSCRWLPALCWGPADLLGASWHLPGHLSLAGFYISLLIEWQKILGRPQETSVCLDAWMPGLGALQIPGLQPALGSPRCPENCLSIWLSLVIPSVRVLGI